ncbi:MAG: glycosyltransferase family 4 protein [Anaerolineaceae bacterium]
MDERLFTIYHKPGRFIEKTGRTLIGLTRRFVDCLRADQYHAILLHKEAFPFGPPWIEMILQSRQPRIIYDMDDSFWTHPPQLKQIGRLLRDPHRIEKMIRLSRHVLAGNQFLADYAVQYNPAVTIFPTVLDTRRYSLREEKPDGKVTIGWVGRWSSSAYIETLRNVFILLSQRYPMICFHFVGADERHSFDGIRYEIIPWRLETEIEDIAAFDIGIMPLADDTYSQGKCGFKLLQYMALGIPAVASSVGVNQTIIQDEVNGFLASTEQEWIDKLTLLISEHLLRRQIGFEARKTVECHYSLSKAEPILISILKSII